MSSHWRVTFMFEGTDAVLVNDEDCHYEGDREAYA